jgi:sugar O-acyltransferase (sialic acid O-acetyltransferase NeuD family)
MKKLVIFGTSSFAKQMHYYFSSTADYHILGFALDREYIVEDNFLGLPVYSTEDLVALTKDENVRCFLALGYKNMRAREYKFNQLKSRGVNFVSYISPHAICQIDLTNIGENSIILANATIEPFSVIGDNVFIWTGVTICHDVVVDDHSFIAAGVVIGGHSVIGENCFLGFNSTVSSGVVLASETLLAANSFIQMDTKNAAFYAGSPATQKNTHLDKGIRIDVIQ